MSIAAARQRRLALALPALPGGAAASGAGAARDPSGVSLRVGMVLVTVGASLWLPWNAVVPIAIAIWLGPNAVRSYLEGSAFGGTNMLLELPGLLGVAVFASLVRRGRRGRG